jgi:hypothetical protein
MTRASSMLCAIGFSTYTCLPARSAAKVAGRAYGPASRSSPRRYSGSGPAERDSPGRPRPADRLETCRRRAGCPHRTTPRCSGPIRPIAAAPRLLGRRLRSPRYSAARWAAADRPPPPPRAERCEIRRCAGSSQKTSAGKHVRPSSGTAHQMSKSSHPRDSCSAAQRCQYAPVARERRTRCPRSPVARGRRTRCPTRVES